ncbi:putative Ig domain-containing protein [Flavitalea sp. BT771]|uniref:putative Ig domain-containing protein n=1 Tax=Flavitalea sp. BT771 TaxID=3063329 RepID=UPI0026E1F2EE|nr:putative Ig domain-containing protein [Flavitalea sp. BT771]MDO6435238.1 putative Ig domain-containing protein [Flavitalea sp. BT771]MDV6224057.1 putative Ig domain-containing protein [Flavitalea sp. BT771]
MNTLRSLHMTILGCLLTASALRAQITAGTVYAQLPDTLAILTPKPSPMPHINGPKVFGVRPGHPIVFTIAATGTRPLVFSADKLPPGVTLDKNTGRISGTIAKAGTYPLVLTVKNKAGVASRAFRLVVGEQVSLTPPMGWNSWNIYATKISQELVLANAKAMAGSGLIDHGWTYMNIDDCWQGRRGGAFHGILPDSSIFPDMQGLCDEVHGLGLKIGIYSTPWVESYGHHIGGSAMNEEGLFEATKEKIPRNKKQLPYAIGSYTFVPNDVHQWTTWGIDYLKYDWSPIEVPETRTMYEALRGSGRDIILSLSNSAPFAGAADWAQWSNCWRTGGDIRDNWRSLKSRLFTQDKWAPYAGPGHWNDPDMMIVGYVGWGKAPRPTLLTPDEQYTHVSAWCLMSVPLLLGCDLTKLDSFTLGLLTNDEVLAINQDPLGKQATVISQQGEAGVMAKELEDGSKVAGLFNPGDSAVQRVTLRWADLGITGRYVVRDLWRQQDIGTFDGEFVADVRRHGVVLVGLRKAGKGK